MTDGDSLQTNTTAAQERKGDEIINILDLEDSKAQGDGGDSNAEGNGFDIAQSFIDGMIEVEHEQYNEDRSQIEREVECDDKTAVEGAKVISDENSSTLWGMHPHWYPPQVPPKWTPKAAQVEKGEPSFDS